MNLNQLNEPVNLLIIGTYLKFSLNEYTFEARDYNKIY